MNLLLQRVLRPKVDAFEGAQIVNTGPRIPAERVPTLFEPFHSLHAPRTDSSQGAGLGLAIVAAIARAHGAPVEASANPEGG